MIKRIFALSIIAVGVVACGGYTEEQAKAADKYCDCMENAEPVTGDEEMDFAINFAECEISLLEEYDGEIMADEGWALALEEKCPSVAGKIADAE